MRWLRAIVRTLVDWAATAARRLFKSPQQVVIKTCEVAAKVVSEVRTVAPKVAKAAVVTACAVADTWSGLSISSTFLVVRTGWYVVTGLRSAVLAADASQPEPSPDAECEAADEGFVDDVLENIAAALIVELLMKMRAKILARIRQYVKQFERSQLQPDWTVQRKPESAAWMPAL